MRVITPFSLQIGVCFPPFVARLSHRPSLVQHTLSTVVVCANTENSNAQDRCILVLKFAGTAFKNDYGCKYQTNIESHKQHRHYASPCIHFVSF